MQQIYLEQRNLLNSPPGTVAADVSRHLQKRQYLGAAIVVCDNPNGILSSTRKQWLKGARYLQKLRASTLNAEEILRLTHAIMHMQNMQFVARSPIDCPGASAYFITPAQLQDVPPNCYTLYLTSHVPGIALKKVLSHMPQHSLVVDYQSGSKIAEFELSQKSALEQKVLDEWQQIATYLQKHKINPADLVVGNSLQFKAMDEALDTLLGVSSDFLQRAAVFQHSISLAQPFDSITSAEQKMFEAVTRLAHRVQALAPGTFNNYLATTFGDKSHDTFFLRDVGSELYEDLEIQALALARG